MSARHLDLDARRAARWEGAGEVPQVVLGGETFDLPVEMPLVFLEALGEMDVGRAVRALVGEEHVERFLGTGPTVEDLLELRELYGIDMGESQASSASSTNGGKPSRPTG